MSLVSYNMEFYLKVKKPGFIWLISHEKQCCCTENHHRCDAVIGTRPHSLHQLDLECDAAFITQFSKIYLGLADSVCLFNHLFAPSNTNSSRTGLKIPTFKSGTVAKTQCFVVERLQRQFLQASSCLLCFNVDSKLRTWVFSWDQFNFLVASVCVMATCLTFFNFLSPHHSFLLSLYCINTLSHKTSSSFCLRWWPSRARQYRRLLARLHRPGNHADLLRRHPAHSPTRPPLHQTTSYRYRCSFTHS